KLLLLNRVLSPSPWGSKGILRDGAGKCSGILSANADEVPLCAAGAFPCGHCCCRGRHGLALALAPEATACDAAQPVTRCPARAGPGGESVAGTKAFHLPDLEAH